MFKEIPLGYFELFYSYFLEKFQLLEGNKFQVNDPDKDVGENWVIEYEIVTFGDQYQPWTVNFTVYNNDIRLTTFQLTEDLQLMVDEFYSTLLTVEDQCTITCSHCCETFQMEDTSMSNSCPYCGETIIPKQVYNIDPSNMEHNYCPRCNTLSLGEICETCGDYIGY